jgi:hypothetical protein
MGSGDFSTDLSSGTGFQTLPPTTAVRPVERRTSNSDGEDKTRRRRGRRDEDDDSEETISVDPEHNHQLDHLA